jgi:hypothetical protein
MFTPVEVQAVVAQLYGALLPGAAFVGVLFGIGFALARRAADSFADAAGRYLAEQRRRRRAAPETRGASSAPL